MLWGMPPSVIHRQGKGRLVAANHTTRVPKLLECVLWAVANALYYEYTIAANAVLNYRGRLTTEQLAGRWLDDRLSHGQETPEKGGVRPRGRGSRTRSPGLQRAWPGRGSPHKFKR